MSDSDYTIEAATSWNGQRGERLHQVLGAIRFILDLNEYLLLTALNDHKGTLTTYWTQPPKPTTLKIIGEIWEKVGNEPKENTEFEIEQAA